MSTGKITFVFYKKRQQKNRTQFNMFGLMIAFNSALSGIVQEENHLKYTLGLEVGNHD